jgi:SAM-dependent methyltransferase
VSTISTNSHHGWTNERPNEVASEFLEAIQTHPGGTVLDLGAAFGVATIPALDLGAVVYANDIDASHISEIEARASSASRERLHLVLGRFPQEVDFEAETFDAILASNVLHFLTGDEVELALTKIARWLRPGGTLHVLVNSPFVGNLREARPMIEARSIRGERWPGEVHGIRSLCKHPSAQRLPDMIHFFTPEILAVAVQRAGLHVENCELFTRSDIPLFARDAGKENLRLCGRRKRR